MKATVVVNVVCTIEDQFALMKLAREEVEAIKPPDDWSLYYPKSPTDALMQVIRTSISNRLLPLECVTLHEIGHNVKDIEMPL